MGSEPLGSKPRRSQERSRGRPGLSESARRSPEPRREPEPAGDRPSIGLGDRIGLATPGHVAAVRHSGLFPVFAQQSIREMTRTGRTPRQVMDDARRGVREAGWRSSWGADADHLKTEADVARCAAAGFVLFTFDATGVIGHRERRGRTPAARWGRAVRLFARLARRLSREARGPFEVEVSLDELPFPTSPEDHRFVAGALLSRGLTLHSLAPRFPGAFEKGVDFRGDRNALRRALAAHAAVARETGGHKLSVHSGSDKFSIYRDVVRLTGGRFHVKTAGTSYLEALRVLAWKAPALFRDVAALSRRVYETARATYHVSGRLSRVPWPEQVRDGRLERAFLENEDARQVLHVAFGAVLGTRGGSRGGLHGRLLRLLRQESAAYRRALASHLGRHVRLLASTRRRGAALALLLGTAVHVARTGTAGAAPPAPEPLMGPWVNRVESGSASVLWVAHPGEGRGIVSFTAGSRTGSARSVPAKVPGRKDMVEVARLEDLPPATPVRYEVRTGGWTAAGEFTTALGRGDRRPFRFIEYGDTRSFPDRHAEVAGAMAKEPGVLFVGLTGDLVEDGDVWDQWPAQFFGPARSFLRQTAFWPVRGNHEGSAVLYKALFDLPGNEQWYSFDCGILHYIGLDSEVEQGQERQAQLRWLQDDLAAHRDAVWTIVSYHEPTFNIGGHASDWGAQDLLPILEQFEVELVVAGHSHLYERFVPIGRPGKRPTIHLVTGGGGARNYEVKPSLLLEGGIGYSGLHYLVFDVAGERLSMTAKKPDGSVLDRMELVKTGDRFQPEVMAKSMDSARARRLATPPKE